MSYTTINICHRVKYLSTLHDVIREENSKVILVYRIVLIYITFYIHVINMMTFILSCVHDTLLATSKYIGNISLRFSRNSAKSAEFSRKCGTAL